MAHLLSLYPLFAAHQSQLSPDMSHPLYFKPPNETNHPRITAAQ